MNTRFYGLADEFDNSKFWETMRKWSAPERGNVVFISETSAPSDFKIVGSREVTSKFSAKKMQNKAYTDNLYVYSSAR